MTLLYTARDSEETIFTTELNSMTNGQRVITASPYSNDAATTERRVLVDIEVTLATQGTARANGANMSVYFLPTLDDTNYAYGGTSDDPPANTLVASIPFDASTSARVNIQINVQLPNSNFHILIKNNTGQTLAASGNTLSMRRHSYEDV